MMNLLPSTLIFLPSLLVAVPMPLDQEGLTYIRGYNYKVSDAPIIDQSNMSHIRITYRYQEAMVQGSTSAGTTTALAFLNRLLLL